MINFSSGHRIGACCLVLAGLGVAACKSDTPTVEAPVAQTVTVVGTDSAESKILSDIYTRALEGAGFRVARRAPVADLAGGYAALNAGAADLFVTYTGELLTYLADAEPAAASTSTTEVATTTTVPETTTTEPADTTAPDTTEPDQTASSDSTGGSTGDDSTTTVSADDSTTTTISTAGQASAISLNLQSNLIGEILPATLQLGAPSNAEKKPVIACNAQSSTGISLLSDLALVADQRRIAGTDGFETGSPFGLVGFTKTFDATFAEFVAVPADKIAESIEPAPDSSTTTTVADSPTETTETTESTEAEPIETDADCGAFDSSLDATISTTMVVLDDDKNWVENNGVVPLMTATAYTPIVSQTVNQVSQALSTVDLREMIRQVDAGAAPSTVAGQWLQLAGLTGS